MEAIKVTSEAAEAIKSKTANKDGAKGLRLTIKSTGCSGHSYQMEHAMEENLGADDKIESNGAVLYIPKINSWMLFGMTVDYSVDNLGNARFEFSNPNESGRCGCGESFHVNVDELKKPQ